MESERSLPHTQVPVTCRYPEPQHSNASPTYFLKIYFNISCLCLGLLSGIFPSGLPTKTPYAPHPSPIHVQCPAYLIPLYLVTQIIIGAEYRS